MDFLLELYELWRIEWTFDGFLGVCYGDIEIGTELMDFAIVVGAVDGTEDLGVFALVASLEILGGYGIQGKWWQLKDTIFYIHFSTL